MGVGWGSGVKHCASDAVAGRVSEMLEGACAFAWERAERFRGAGRVGLFACACSIASGCGHWSVKVLVWLHAVCCAVPFAYAPPVGAFVDRTRAGVQGFGQGFLGFLPPFFLSCVAGQQPTFLLAWTE
jgi:hypothetical protein